MGSKTKIKAKENNLKLSIQVSLNGLSFCGIDHIARKILFFKNVHYRKQLNPIEVLQKIEMVYEDEAFLQKEFEDVIVLFSNEFYSLVPEKFFKEENASDYLKFNTKILETDFVAQDYIKEFNLVNVYVPFTNVNNYFFDKYGEFEYRHCVSVLVEGFLKLNQNQEKEAKVYLNNHTWGYDLVIIQQGKLLFVNSFHCKTKEDFIYYLLFTAEQLELDPTTFELILLGHISKNSDYYNMAYTYIKNISFLETSFGFSFEANQQPPKAYNHYTLLKALQ